MNLRTPLAVALLGLTSVLVVHAGASPARAQVRRASLTVSADQPGPQISRHIYGHFAEHLGRCIYDGLWVGPDSPIPNTRGIRNDVIEALRAIRIPNLRWPGGCFADQYHWEDGVGPVEERPDRVNIHWGGVVEDNSFGTHEFLDFCELIGADPYIAANVGSGTPQEMSDWVEYMTFPGDSEITRRRKANGREKPWSVPFLGIGNENWGCGGRMTPEYYSDLYRRFSVYARDWEPNELQRIAAGPGGTELEWLDVLAGRVRRGIEGISMHYYTIGSPRWNEKLPSIGFEEDGWFKILHSALEMEELLVEAEEIMARHDPENRIGLYVDEWGTWYEPLPGSNPAFLVQQNTIRDAVVAGATFNIFHDHAERVKMANIAQLVNVLQALILTEGEAMVLTPTYHVFDMYQVHHDATSLPVALETEYVVHGSETIPAVSASASKDEQGRLHLSLVNLDPHAEVALDASIQGAEFGEVTGRVLTAEALDAHNTVADPDRVKPGPFTGATLSGSALEARLPPRSVVVLTLAAGS
jgi:alpha-N-arabinofuranosidase